MTPIASSQHIYDPVVEIYGGNYPEALHTAFARAWRGLQRKGCITFKMYNTLQKTPALSLSLSGFFCDKLNEAAMMVCKVKAISKEARKEIKKVKNAAMEAKGMAEEVKEAADDAGWSVYNMAGMADCFEEIVRGY